LTTRGTPRVERVWAGWLVVGVSIIRINF